MTVYYNERLSQYITDLYAQEDEALAYIRENIPRQGLPPINIHPEEGRFLQFLVQATGAQKVVEIGTLGGYSGTWIARGLAPRGSLITVEVNPHHANVAKDHFERAGVSDVIDLRVGDAHQLLEMMYLEGPFDFVFIDAEKGGYLNYLDWALRSIRPGGVIAAHNAFRKGSIAGLKEDDEWTQITRDFNRRVAENKSLISTIFPAGDGMLVAVKTG